MIMYCLSHKTTSHILFGTENRLVIVLSILSDEGQSTLVNKNFIYIYHFKQVHTYKIQELISKLKLKIFTRLFD